MWEQYQFHVTLKLIDCDTHPQQQAFKHLSKFVASHERSDTLLIIYYAGHGYPSVKNQSCIALSGLPIWEAREKIAQSIEWVDVERILSTTSSDVLVIFDCCRAGLLCRSAKEGETDPNRCFQFLGACESEQQTYRARERSFTTPITWALKELARESKFPLTKLVREIEEHENFPPGQRPVLFGSRYNPICENIHLARMGNSTTRRKAAKASESATSSNPTPCTGFIMDLRFY